MLTPTLLALAITTPAAFALAELTRLKRRKPYGRRARRKARTRIAILTGASCAALAAAIALYV